MSDVFKALADKTRRKLLDALFRRDGQTLAALCEKTDLSRFGTMKHLGILKDAHLVTFRRVGREKFHYLNPLPIRRIHDRWISKYQETIVDAMAQLKHSLEGNMNQKPKHVYEVYIRTSAEKLWQAITQPEFTRQFFYGSAVQSSWKVGASIVHKSAEDECMIEGVVLESVPHQKLVHTFRAMHEEDMMKDRPSRVTWTIEPMGAVCKLTLIHDDFDSETKTFFSVGPGWNPVLSGLKTLLETGRALEIPQRAA